MNSEEMKKWAFDNQTYVKLKDGDSITAVLLDAKAVPNTMDPTKETMLYSLRFDGKDVKSFQSSSGALAETMADLLGKEITLQRHGEGINTKYSVCETKDQKAWDES